MKTKCLIVDDEPPARELLVSYVSKLEDFEIAAQFDNGVDSFNYLQRNSVDLIFLDIQMPGMSGLELIQSLKEPPGIILTTAFREHASTGFDLDVLDYLVKPISFARFMKAIAKFNHYNGKNTDHHANDDSAFDQAYFFVKVGKDQVKIHYKHILYIESIKDYIKIITVDRSYITYERLMHMEEKLPDGKFLRIHKSYIIAVGKVKAFRNDSVVIGNTELPVGRVFKQKFMEVFSRQPSTS